MALPELVTALALMLYMVFTGLVGAARGKYNIKAPAISGNMEFEKRFRVQQNTLEQIALFLPVLWLFTFVSGKPSLAAGIGAIWLLGRVIYAIGYYAKPETRLPGFVLGFLSSAALLLGSLGYIIGQLLSH